MADHADTPLLAVCLYVQAQSEGLKAGVKEIGQRQASILVKPKHSPVS